MNDEATASVPTAQNGAELKRSLAVQSRESITKWGLRDDTLRGDYK